MNLPRHTDRSIELRERFAQGAPLPPGTLSPSLQRSWERSRAAGLRPRDKALFHHYVSEQHRRSVKDIHRSLIDVATPDMEHLLRTMGSPKWVVLLTNPQGTIVHALGDRSLAPRDLQLPLTCGRSLLESEIGSNAPLIAGREGAPILLHGGDHYLEELRAFTCAAAPVLNPQGRVAAVLDVTGIDVSADQQTLARVWRAAWSIEGRLFEQHPEGALIRLHEDPRFIDTPEQALLLVGRGGELLGANSLARAMLGLPGPAKPDLLPDFENLFDARSTSTLRRRGAYNGEEARHRANASALQTHSGATFYATWQFLGESTRASSAIRHPTYSVRSTPPVHQGPPHRVDPTWQTAFDRAGRIYPQGLAVLIQGETGTGKEWFARTLHQEHRPNGPFVAVNCAALAESMAEAELFSYVEGAFTGARRGGAAGRMEQANGGTLFLDEIGDMPAHLQTRLLRVLQERSVLRIGGSSEIPLDVLVLSASHRNLDEMVESGSFRQDLYFRLNSLQVCLPALRERLDIEQLIDDCLVKDKVGLPMDLRTELLGYSWPGNLREMTQTLRVAALLAGPQGTITREMISLRKAPALAPAGATRRSADATLQEVHHNAAAQALQMQGGNVAAAARHLGVSRTTLYKYLRAQR